MLLKFIKIRRKICERTVPFRQIRIFNYDIFLLISFLLILIQHERIGADSPPIQAPRFTTQPSSSSSIVSETGTKILQCHALGYPQPVYKWLKNGVSVTEFTNGQYYRIQNANKNDVGSYSCLAKNDAGTIFSEKINIAVAYMEGFQDLTERTVSVLSGHAAILDLALIDSVPKPQVTWLSAEGPLDYDIKYATTLDNQLIILSVSKSDELAYRARAINTQLGKEEYSPFIRLNVTGDEYMDVAPQVIVSPRSVKAVKGEEIVEIQCIANAKYLHELETLWFKDEIPIENAGIRYTFNDPWNRTMALMSLNMTHNGMYVCKVRLKSGGFEATTDPAEIVVQEQPSFFQPLRSEILGDFGSSLTIPCDAIGEPFPNITWYKDAKLLDLSSERYAISESNALIIKKLSLDDSAMFQCLAENDAGEKSTYTWVKVKTSKPIMDVAPQNTTVLDGKDATIQCQVTGYPKPNVTWIYNETIFIQSDSRYQVLESGDLLVENVKETDAGLYKCVRSNEAGTVVGESYLTVLVRTQIVQPPVDTTVLLGTTAALQCRVSSDPKVPFNIDWYRESRTMPITNGQRIQVKADGTLEIQAVRAADVGEYACVVTSPGGNETRSARLSVVELPFPPINVRAERLPFERNVNVTWTPGFDGNSKILKFIVQKREEEEGIVGPIPDMLQKWVTCASNVSADSRSVVIKNLRAATSYQFRVSAVNNVGEGSPSEPSNTIKLPQEAPSGPPLSFVGSARSSSEIITQWQPPAEEHRNGQILGYIIRFRLFGYNISWYYRNVTNEAQRSYLIQDLITWKDYIVQIAAYNNMGVGVYTEGAKIKTKEGIPEAPPTNLKAMVVNSTAVQISWLPPNPQRINGINQGYKLQAWRMEMVNGEMEEVEARIKNVPPNLLDPLAEQSAIMDDLEKYTDYNFTVLCFTNPGDGIRSEKVLVRTEQDVPDEITALQFSDISDRELKVSWKPPKKSNGILTGYQLKYQIKDFPNTLKIVNLTNNETTIRVRELMATTHYSFEVTAWTIVGAGPPKTATIQSGIKPTIPHAPKNLALSNIGAFSVVLQFTPGFDGNSSIVYWIIQAQTSRNMSWFNLTQIHDPEASSLLVNGLKPFSQYKLRIAAMNVAGTSEFSEATKEFQTIMAPPKNPPLNVTVRAISGKELRIRWIPLQNSEWFGNPKGYNISYKHINSFDGVFNFSNIFVDDPTANSFILENLEEWSVYEIAMGSCNEVGCSPDSPVAVERTREAVPSEGPSNVQANATSSTTIVVTWQDVTKPHQNGLIEGYKVLYSHPGRASVLKKEIPQNSTFTTTLTELKKFTIYTIQVLAYTRLGDGALSLPLRVQTFDDTPGVPSNVSFPDVSFSTARIIWDVPEEPNGEILAYRVTYALNGTSIQNFSKEFPSSDRTYRATNLEAEKYYLFSVTAQTRLGWGRTGYFLVFTTNSREIPQAPSAPQISRGQIQAKQITFNWTPGRDGLAPLRYYSIQYRENDGPWTAIPERVDPMVVSYTATNLKPFSIYQFRIQATNDIGSSTYSKESTDVRTLSAAPSKGIENLKVVPITTTSVRVQWTALKKNFWNGDFATGGYRVFFQQVTEFQSALQEIPKFDVMGIDKEDVVLNDLTQDNNYEISVAPFNSQGIGLASTPIVVYVGEAVPTGEPREVKATALSSTEVFLEWKPPKHDMQNGDLLGYKIFYVVTDFSNHIDQKHEEEIEVVPASYNSHSLVFLDKFTEYKIQILAFNPAGDGPRSKAVKIKTHQDLPGPPSNLRFADITMNSLEVSWNTPKNRNGEILGYVVTYETTEDNEKFSKQVKQKVTGNSLVVQNLEEEVTYTFTVRAQTIDYGPAVSGNVTTGPQEGSPVALRELHLSKNLASVDLHWMNGLLIKDKILGYYIESKKRDDSRWQLVVKTTNGPMQDFTISYQTLLPSTSYKFRVSAYNKYGISYPIYAKESILTPSKLYLEYGYLQQKPFYRQTWFMISLAATSVIIIIMVVAILCVKSKSYKYKQEAQKTLEESMAMSIDERQELALELYRSRHGMGSTGAPSISGTLGRRTLGRKSNNPTTSASLGKTPPRPSPASVHYHSDEESLKCYDENPDDSSVTEKPSEMSSSDSQNSESENESVHNDPHSFVNHYANVNDSLKQSWNRQKPVRNYSSYTDSEPEGSTVMSLNGGQIIMNNMARSRAPLPGFSSFV